MKQIALRILAFIRYGPSPEFHINPLLLAVLCAGVHICVALVVAFVAHFFTLGFLDDGYAATLTQWDWVRIAALRAIPWQLAALFLAWVFFNLGQACVENTEGAYRDWVPWFVALSGFAVLGISVTLFALKFVIEKPYF